MHDTRALQEQHIESEEVVPDERVIAEERLKLSSGLVRGRRARYIAITYARQPLDGVGHRPVWIDEGLEPLDDAPLIEANGADLDDAVVVRIQAGGLKVQRDVMHAHGEANRITGIAR